MQKPLLVALLLPLLLGSACQSSDSQTSAQEPAASVADMPPPPPPRVSQLQFQASKPQEGDVFVIQFQPEGTTDTRYFFYHVYRVTPDSAYLHPARKEATDPNADLTQPDFQASTSTIAYTLDELTGLLKQQPGDALKTQLIQVRRAD